MHSIISSTAAAGRATAIVTRHARAMTRGATAAGPSAPRARSLFPFTSFAPRVSPHPAPSLTRQHTRGIICLDDMAKPPEPFVLPPDTRVGFIGAGAMANAIAKGIGGSQLLPYSQMWMSDLNPGVASDLSALGVNVGSSNAEVVRNCNVLLVATKPDQVCTALQRERVHIAERNLLVVSVAAGLTLAALEAALLPKTRVARVMPNTPALVGAGATGFAMGGAATDHDAQVVAAIFNSIGKAVKVNEKDLNGVTGLSGSGPAYVFLFIEALADGGVRAGLTRPVAMQLAIQTVLGSAQLIQTTGKHPGQLKDQVTSPGGTTIAGVHALEDGGFRGTVMNAVLAATTKAQELGLATAPKSKL